MKLLKIIFMFFILCSTIVPKNGEIIIAKINGEIDLGLAPHIKRVVEEAEKISAEAIIFEINTFGGRVDAATQIKDAILNCKVKTIAFIDKRAISAGALISLSCEKIVMVPGASIGASTVVDQSGEKQAEKYQSYMRSEMRSTAEKNKRPTKIAEGMVDERIVVNGLVDSTQLITLTSEEAVKYGIADTILTSIAQVKDFFNLEEAEIIEFETNWAEDLVRFINNPIISSLLIMIGLVGLFTEIKTPGWGLPGTAAVIALVLFFGTNYILELASGLEIMIFVIGVILLIIEIFVTPGFGVIGIIGIICIVGSLFLGLVSDFPSVDTDMLYYAAIQLGLAFVFSTVAIIILSRFLPKTKMWSNLILEKNIDASSGYVSYEPEISDLSGEKGKAITDLRPSGTASFGGKKYDVVTSGEYITKGTDIIIVKVEGSKIVVESV